MHMMQCQHIVLIVFMLVYHIHMSVTASPGGYYLYDQLQICSPDLILTLLKLDLIEPLINVGWMVMTLGNIRIDRMIGVWFSQHTSDQII